VDGNQLSYAACGNRTGFCCGFDRSYISANEYRDVAIEKILLTDENDIRGFHHGVGSLDSADQTARFNHSEGFHEAANLPESLPKSN
jgi:hypothetical protein